MNTLDSRKPHYTGFLAKLKREDVLAGALVFVAIISVYFVGEHWLFNTFNIYAAFGFTFARVLVVVVAILTQAALSVLAVALIRSKKGQCTFFDNLSASILPAFWVWSLYICGLLKRMDPYDLETYHLLFVSVVSSVLFCLGTAAVMLVLTVAFGKFYKRNNSNYMTASNTTKMLAAGLIFASALTAVGLPLCIKYAVSAPLGSAILTIIAQVVITALAILLIYSAKGKVGLINCIISTALPGIMLWIIYILGHLNATDLTTPIEEIVAGQMVVASNLRIFSRCITLLLFAGALVFAKFYKPKQFVKGINA